MVLNVQETKEFKIVQIRAFLKHLKDTTGFVPPLTAEEIYEMSKKGSLNSLGLSN